jgi:hypothetical protein
MPKKLPAVDQVLDKIRATAQKTQQLMDEARTLHHAAEAAHEQSERIHGQIVKTRLRKKGAKMRGVEG